MATYSQLSLAKNVKMATYSQLSLAKKTFKSATYSQKNQNILPCKNNVVLQHLYEFFLF